MSYCVESSKSFYEATFDLKPVIQRLGFEVQQIHDLGEILQRKGIGLDEDCQVFELCNYRYMERLLALDMRLGLCLPWRISVFTRDGATWIALGELVPPGEAPGPELAALLAEIREKLVLIIDETR